MGLGLVVVLLGLAAACGRRPGNEPVAVAAPSLPEPDKTWNVFPPGARAADLAPAIEEGLRNGKGAEGEAERETPDQATSAEFVRFVILRAAERHGARYRKEFFHVVVGAGIELPEGALLIQRDWHRPGMITGNNEQPQAYGLAVVVEPGAPRPFHPAVVAAVQAFVAALARKVPLHPDCVVAMEELAYTTHDPADAAERELANKARKAVPPLKPDGTLEIVSSKGSIQVAYELRHTTPGIAVGMMLRHGFDGENRGMLFRYAWRATRRFWMKNCRIPIALAYIARGRIEQIVAMQPQWGAPAGELRYYQSSTPVRWVLEMPAGWFADHGVKIGDPVRID